MYPLTSPFQHLHRTNNERIKCKRIWNRGWRKKNIQLKIRGRHWTAFYTNNHEEATHFINELNKTGEEKSLKLNAKKTKHIHIGETDSEDLFIDDDKIERVDHFKYLGSIKTNSGDCTTDINSGLGMAKKRMTKLYTIWKDKSITRQLKIKLVKCLTWAVMTYGTEGWTLKAKQIKKIHSAEMWFYRRMLRVSWREKRIDESILKELGTKRKLVNFIKKRKLSFIGHACRSKCSLMKDIMQGKVEGKRGRGRPRMQYIDNAKSWTGKSASEIFETTVDRDGWRETVGEAVRAANVQQSDAG